MPGLRGLLARIDSEQLMTYSMFMVEFAAGLFAIINGANLLSQVTCSAVGFRFLGFTLIIIGVALVILWFISCTMANHNPVLVTLKFVYCSVPLVLVLFGLGIFVLAVSSEGGGESVPGRSYKVYNVESYSKWMQSKVSENWDKYYKKDVVQNKEFVCANFLFPDEYQIGPDPAFETGCCDVPKDCNFNYTNSGVYLNTSENNGNNYTNDDCNKWNSDPNTLCFDCESCKAGFLQDVTSRWTLTGLYLVVLEGFFTVLMVILVIFSCASDCESPHHYTHNIMIAVYEWKRLIQHN